MPKSSWKEREDFELLWRRNGQEARARGPSLGGGGRQGTAGVSKDAEGRAGRAPAVSSLSKEGLRGTKQDWPCAQLTDDGPRLEEQSALHRAFLESGIGM